MKKKFIFLLIILFCVIYYKGALSDELYDVSIIQLIATPEKYHEKAVSVVGVGRIEFEANGLYLTKEHYNLRVPNTAIWIDIESNESLDREQLSKYNGKYVIVEGIFNMNDRGHFGLYCGSLEYVISYRLYSQE